MGRRQVIYKTDLVDNRGVVFGESQESIGLFISFSSDYREVIIETLQGEVVRVRIDQFRFRGPES